MRRLEACMDGLLKARCGRLHFLFILLLGSWFVSAALPAHARPPKPTSRAQVPSADPVRQSLSESVGRPETGNAGTQQTTTEIMEREKAIAVPGGVVETEADDDAFLRPDRRHLPQNPDSPAAPPVPLLREGTPVTSSAPNRDTGPFTPQTVSTNFTGATLSGINPTGAFPP